MEPGTLVLVKFTSLGKIGFAHIRHCTPGEDSGHLIGVEFRDTLIADERNLSGYEYQSINTTVAWNEPEW